MAKNQSLPARLQEKDSRSEDDLTMYGYHEKPTAWWPRPSLSNPRSTNDIVWAFLRASPTLLWFVTNRVLTNTFKNIFAHFVLNLTRSDHMSTYLTIKQQLIVLFMDRWIGLCELIIIQCKWSWVFSFSLKYFYKKKMTNI